jgi:pantoate--beta-alanine ligase
MKVIETVADLRRQTASWRCQGLRSALVPTMGNLHAGHLSLLAAARPRADRLVTSIFVNPTQFAPGEDYASYPRSLSQDTEALAAAGCDLLFAPAVEEVYPASLAPAMVGLEPGPLAHQLCGAFRPGHFSGVLQVVARLFNFVQPDLAVFGEKDYQQLILLQALGRDLAFPIQIDGVATVREVDGLAMSSRNQYLDPVERVRAAALYRGLCLAAAELADGRSPAEVEQRGYARLREAGFQPDYVAVRRALDLQPAGCADRSLRVLAAARLGRTRLIDNVAVEL